MTEGLLQTIAPASAPKVQWVNADVAAFAPAGGLRFHYHGRSARARAGPRPRALGPARAAVAGRPIFMSTCANCPTVDHIYHFETVDEIRSMIVAAGLDDRDEIVVPSEDLSDEDLARYRLDILYAAILTT